jgi:methyltransferase (TIGR00027 family)
MAQPNLNFLVNVGQIRYLQSKFERGGLSGPDHLVEHFLSPRQRLVAYLRHALYAQRVVADPFYAYLRSRTLHYDDAFVAAIYDGCKLIVNIGTGTDTRAYRFGALADWRAVQLIEADQPKSIARKQERAVQAFGERGVSFLSLDLNEPHGADFDALLERCRDRKALVMMEGVSPYVLRENFIKVLERLQASLADGSRVAYDYKLDGHGANLGNASAAGTAFRLSAGEAAARAFHEALGFRVEKVVASGELEGRRQHGTGSTLCGFTEDVLIELAVVRRSSTLP